jgi:peptide/nickel transport system permease protein
MSVLKLTYGVYINLFVLGIFVLLAVFSPFIANDRPILCKSDKGLSIPVLSQKTSEDCKPLIKPLIQYRYHNIDDKNANYTGPFKSQELADGQQRHFLGTDQLGRDVAAGMVHGSRIAMITGGLSMLIALVIGMFFGLLGGFYGNDSLRVKRSVLFIFIAFILFTLYLIAYPKAIFHSYFSVTIYLVLLLIVFLCLILLARSSSFLAKKITIPLDLLFSNFIEIFQSLPGSFIILILVSLFTKASIYNVILIIGLLRWPMIARYVRAEMLKIKEQRYIEASRAIGMKDWRIILKHAMPATLTPVIVALAFGFSSAILLESTLSFLGIGLPADHVSFGSMLSEVRHNYEAWWLALFPGMAIFLLIFIFNYLGDNFSRLVDKK